MLQENESEIILPQPNQPVAPAIDSNIHISNALICNNNSSFNVSQPTCMSGSRSSATDDLTDLIFKSKGLHIANLNVRHIVPKIDELRIIMASEKGPDVFGACETFLDTGISDSQVAINGYEFLRKDRCSTQDKIGGGVILYYRNSLICKRKQELEISNIETLWSELALPNSKHFLICTVYRPPNSPSGWIDLFEEELSIAQTTGLEIILMGDFNIDVLHCSNNKWLNLVQLFDLTQMVTDPTRVTQTSSSIIDHVYSSNPENISECFVPHYSISDHFPICFTRKINFKISKAEHTSTSYRCFKVFNEESFISDLSNELNTFTLSQSDIDDDVTAWYVLIIKHLDRHAPLKTKRVKTKRLPDWYTPEIIQARKMRDISKSQKNWTDYKRYRNTTKHLIRKAKCKHFSESVTNLKDTKSIWQHLRSVNNKSKVTTSSLPNELNIDNERITDSQDIAGKLNEYFTSVAKRLNQDDITSTSIDFTKLQHFISTKVPENTYFKIPSITTQQVSSFIQNLDSSKATGLDGIGPRLLKMVNNIISPSIAALINKSLNVGKFPKQLKIAKVFPIFKSGSKSDPSNYRPISILPTISKIFEKHVNKHLMGYLNKYKLIHECQSGFRQKHSCQTALVKLIDQWMACIDNGDIVGTLFIDFRKAFDMVDHSLLIKKLSLYKLSNTALDWFTSYLNTRLQTIVCDQNKTNFSQLQSGVPQGSILGPTLFLLFINDLPLFMNYCSTELFADDTTFHINGKTINEIEVKLQNDSKEANAWSKRNKMPINYDKTTSMTVGTRQRLRDTQQLDINIDDNIIVPVNKHKLLGIYIDENLLWTSHIDYLCSTISSRISLLKQLSTYVPTNVQKMYYQGYILPLIDYGSNTWGTTYKINIERLNKLQKRAARIILKAEFTTPSSDMFKELGWISVASRLDYNKAILTYKALNNLTPSYISDLLIPVSQTCTRILRSSENGSLVVPRSRTALYDRSFSTSAPKLWNSLPYSIKSAHSLNAFKKCVKEYF